MRIEGHPLAREEQLCRAKGIEHRLTKLWPEDAGEHHASVSAAAESAQDALRQGGRQPPNLPLGLA
jgi:hypothetical protein